MTVALCYPRARKAGIKGPYIFQDGAQHCRIDLKGPPVEVSEDLARLILTRDGDIIKEASKISKGVQSPKTKMVDDKKVKTK